MCYSMLRIEIDHVFFLKLLHVLSLHSALLNDNCFEDTFIGLLNGTFPQIYIVKVLPKLLVLLQSVTWHSNWNQTQYCSYLP